MHVKFDGNDIIKQLQAYTDNVLKFDIDSIIADCLDEIADMLLEEMQSRVAKHKKKGRAYNAIERTPVRRAANYQWVEVGALNIRTTRKDGFHVVYQEYGSPGRFAADPWLRPVMEKSKAKINKLILEVFKRKGISNVKA
jgi:hypothetical protein